MPDRICYQLLTNLAGSLAGNIGCPTYTTGSPSHPKDKETLPYLLLVEGFPFPSEGSRDPSGSSPMNNRLYQVSQRPFRKIKVKHHLGPGYNPNVLVCLQASRIVADELTVRLARRCVEIESLPYDAGKVNVTIYIKLPVAIKIMGWYQQTCQELFEFTDLVESLRKTADIKLDLFEQQSIFSYQSLFKSTSKQPLDIPKHLLAPKQEDLDEIVFGSECKDPVLITMAAHLNSKLFHILERAVQRHKPIILLVAQEINKKGFLEQMVQSELQQFLTRFHWQRIAVRLLIGHCVALSKPLPMKNMIGIFCTKTPIEEIVLESLQMAEEMCYLTYGCIPPVELSCNDENLDLLYIPSHLQHIIFELLKNAMRSVIEKEQHRVGTDGVIKTRNIAPIIVHWEVSSHIQDYGTGIPPHILKDVFDFHYTTAAPPTKTSVMAGYGYGLPLSRIYARFLKGDIWLETKEGVGTCIYVQCKMNWDPEELI